MDLLKRRRRSPTEWHATVKKSSSYLQTTPSLCRQLLEEPWSIREMYFLHYVVLWMTCHLSSLRPLQVGTTLPVLAFASCRKTLLCSPALQTFTRALPD